MAKGDPSGLYVPEPLEDTTIQALRTSMERELQKLFMSFERALAREVEFLNVAPVRPREGMIRGADGTNWNPGSGKGVYCYYGGVWVKL